MTEQDRIERLLVLDSEILDVQSLINKDGGVSSIDTLEKMKFNGNNLICDLQHSSLELFQLKDYFVNVNNVFNDELPTDNEYFSLKKVLEKYSLLYPERCQEIMKGWEECLLSIKIKYQELLQQKQEALQRTNEIISYLNIEKLSKNYRIEVKDNLLISNLSLDLEIDCTKGIATELAACFQFLKSYFVFIPFDAPIACRWMSTKRIKINNMQITNTCGAWGSARIIAEIPPNAKSATFSFHIHVESNYTHFGVINKVEHSNADNWLGGLGGWGFSSAATRNISQIHGNTKYQNPIESKYTTGDTVSFTEDFESKRLILSVEGKPNSTSIINYPGLTPNMQTVVSLGSKGSCVELLGVQFA